MFVRNYEEWDKEQIRKNINYNASIQLYVQKNCTVRVSEFWFEYLANYLTA